MNAKKYIKMRLADLCVYAVAVFLVYIILYFDKNMDVSESNRNYVVLLLVVIGVIYVLIDYFIKQNHIKQLNEINAQNVIQKLPKPRNEIEKTYQQIIKQIENKQKIAISQIEKNKMDEIELLTLLAHRLKTPITTISLLADNIEERSQQAIKEELFRLSEDVNKMLFYARSNDFTNDYVISDVSVKKVMNASIKKHSTIFIAKGISVDISILENFVLSDEKWLSFIIDQLISNAVKYTKTQGCIAIRS